MSTFLELPAQYWPAVIALIASLLGILRWSGMLVRPADPGDLKVFETKLLVLESFHHENREEHGTIRKEQESIREKNEREHREIRDDVGKVAASVARIEGKLDGKR